MKAIVVEPGDHAPRLAWQKAPDPVMGPEEVLVAVRATAVNRADLLQARGQYPPPPGVTDILGLEMAGIGRGRGGCRAGLAAGGPGDGAAAGRRVCASRPLSITGC